MILEAKEALEELVCRYVAVKVSSAVLGIGFEEIFEGYSSQRLYGGLEAFMFMYYGLVNQPELPDDSLWCAMTCGLLG